MCPPRALETNATATPALYDSFTTDASDQRDLGPESNPPDNLTFAGNKKYTYNAYNRLVKAEHASKAANFNSRGPLTVPNTLAKYASGRRMVSDTFSSPRHF